MRKKRPRSWLTSAMISGPRQSRVLLLLFRRKVKLRHRRPADRLALVKRDCDFVPLCPVVYGEAPGMLGRAAPHAYAGVRAVLAVNVVAHVDILQLAHIAIEVAHDALQRVHSGFLWRHATTH